MSEPIAPRPVADPESQVGSTPPPGEPSTVDESSGRGAATACAPSAGRFRVLRAHAKGGLGEVFVAFDEDLRREVALKEIRAERAGDPTSRERFFREAEITGRLEHPGVVPVYGLGHYADGRPFYVMRFIRGQSLRDAIAEFHRGERPVRDPGERALALRRLLGRFVDACNAVAYAHSRGVLHRDIKPDNIMLGPYGETLVVDWGLAKPVGQGPDAPAETAEKALRLESGSGSTLTVAGSALGTPDYMSPEQAAGEAANLGPASDVYSLGATLYALLTGRSPFQGGEMGAVLERVRKSDFPPPRQVNSRVPAVLEAVCLKAMAPRPEDRYPSARALADDIERWLADEPVRVHQEPLLQRLGRWERRHKPLVAGATALLLTAVVALTVGILLVNAERKQTELARAQQTKRKQQARQALDALSSEVIDEWLSKQQALTPDHRKFLEQALRSYEEFAADTAQDEQSLAGVATAYLRVGNIHQRLGQTAEADAAYQQGVARCRRLAADFPDRPEHRQSLATGQSNWGFLLERAGRVQEAEAAHRDAFAVRGQLAADFPDRPDYRRDLAGSYYNLASLLAATDRREEAENYFGEALAIRKRLAAEFPNAYHHRRDLALGYNNAGNLLANTGRLGDAVATFREAVDAWKKLAADFPATPVDRREMAGNYNNLGRCCLLATRPDDARAAFGEALAVRRQLAADFPTVPAYRLELAGSCNKLGYAHRQTGRDKEAEDAFREAVAVAKKLAADFPDVPAYRQELAGSCNNLATVFAATDRAKDAEELLRESLAVWRRFAAESPADPAYQNELAGILGNLAEVARKRNDFQASLRLLGEAIPYHQAALKSNPRHPVYLQYFCNHIGGLAETHLLLNDHAAAAAGAARLIEVAGAPGDTYNAACLLARCAPVAEKDAKLPQGKRGELARDYAERAMSTLRQAVAKGFRDAAHMKKDGDLASLRRREDFTQLIADLEKGQPPAKPPAEAKPK